MEDEHTYDDEYLTITEDDPDSGLTDEDRARAHSTIRKVAMVDTIKRAFQTMNDIQLREWFVYTFVMDGTALTTLRSLERHRYLDEMMLSDGWPTIEHEAIGHRLQFEIEPDRQFAKPNLIDVDSWRSAETVAYNMMRIMNPWKVIRYDPESENWYKRVKPGQWKRLGKGAPGQNMAERWISKAMARMDFNDPEHYDLYERFPIDTTMEGQERAGLLFEGSKKAFKKFRNAVQTAQNVRKILEREPIMWLDHNTLNRIRTMAPFANGMLVLTEHQYFDVDGVTKYISPGQLKPMDAEYMVTNANSLRWEDRSNQIPIAIYEADLAYDNHGVANWSDVDSLEFQIMAQNCPTYASFLDHAFQGEPEEAAAFMRLLGAAMYGTNLKIVAAMIGEPNAGKDTVINWLSYLMPNQVAALPFSAFTPHGDEDRGFAPLMGARVATVSGEVGEGRGSKLLAEKIKTVSSGGGTLRVAEKYEKPTTIFFDGMLFLQGNSVPTIAGGDRALYENRLVAVEFKHPFPLRTGSFEARYRAEAASFAKVLFLNYYKYDKMGGGMDGIAPPEEWKKFAKVFAEASNVHGFIENAITISDDPIPTHQFHAALSAMVERFGSPYKVGANHWPKRLRALGFQIDKKGGTVRRQANLGTERKLCYYLTLDADKSDGAFTQSQWESVLADAAVTS